MKPRLLFIVGITVICFLLVMLLYSPFATIEQQVTAAKHRWRGVQAVDSNIVLVYIDNEAIGSLGWPVRRNFHALMVKALHDLGAKSVGIEVQFENTSPEYPEYDALLAAVVAQSGNVVLTSYFGVVPAQSETGASGVPQLNYPLVRDPVQSGEDLHLPMSALLRGAAGVGHVNIADNADVPLFIGASGNVLPAFGLEVLRVYCEASREAIRYDDGTVTIPGNAGDIHITSKDGFANVDPPSAIGAFPAYPFLEVLRSYDALRAGHSPAIPVQRFKGKIILVGVIAEGRSVFVGTPIHPRLASLVYHASFVDNALRSAFPVTLPKAVVVLLSALLALVCAVSILLLNSPTRNMIALGVLVVVCIVSYILFVAGGIILPLTPLLFVGLVSTLSSLFFRHRFVREQLDELQSEKEKITAQLADREAKLAVLERELLDFETRKTEDRTHELLEEIRKYKAEIRTLSSKANDLVEFIEEPANQIADKAEFERIVYSRTGKMKPLVEFIGKIAGSDAPVLILGESGTGKELVAKAIHMRSNRSSAPFVAVNCGALSESLLESELFGHERGAFTGAVKDKAGRFELADRGTILLDEIGEVNEGFQLKLLRVLQEGELERVGGTKTLKVDVRIVAATNKDLREQVKARKFREDLFYRLNVLTIELPPLRERQEDIPLLIGFFLNREGGNIRISKNVMDALQNYTWPGNIRELESAIKRAVLLTKADNRSMISMKDINEEISAAIEGAVAIEDQVLESVREKGFSRSAITETAADLGGLNRGTVAEYLRGQFLKAFAEHGFNIEHTVRYISLTAETDVNDRVHKKLLEYLSNIAEGIDSSRPWESVKATLKPKTKNLPQRYHRYLEQVAEAYFRGLWNLRPVKGERSSA